MLFLYQQHEGIRPLLVPSTPRRVFQHKWNWWRFRIFYHLPGEFGRRRIRTRGVEKIDFHDRPRPEDNAVPEHQGAGHLCGCGGEAA